MSELGEKIELFKRLDAKRSREGFGPEEEELWAKVKEWLERLWAHDDLPPSSRRTSLRVPSRMAVTFEDDQGFARAYLRNISEGGVYVATERNLRMGDRFRLKVVVQHPARDLDLPVEVVWVNKNPSPESGLQPGVGVAWLDLSVADKLTVKAIVYGALDEIAVSEEPGSQR